MLLPPFGCTLCCTCIKVKHRSDGTDMTMNVQLLPVTIRPFLLFGCSFGTSFLVAASCFADFEAATDVLAAYIENEEGELVWNEHSYFAFMEKVEELDFSDYFPGDYEEYEFKCQALSIRLIRATSVAQVEAIFAELEAYQSSIPTIAERFETELLKLEGRESTEDEINGIISLAEDQLKDLNTLYEMLNGEVTEEQQVRFDNIQAARAALEAAEEAAGDTGPHELRASLHRHGPGPHLP